tara:strand:- start:716 stop:1009 length:294 start_codon:yes stop_codon:yes gene_type:complete
MPTRRNYQLREAPRIEKHNHDMAVQAITNERKRQEEEELLRFETERYKELDIKFKSLLENKKFSILRASMFLNISSQEFINMRKEYRRLAVKYSTDS